MMRSRVVAWIVLLFLMVGVSAYAQRPTPAPAPIPRVEYFSEFEFPAMPPMPPMPIMPAMPEMPPMPPMPLMPELPGWEGFHYSFGQQETVDPAIKLQQEVFRTIMRNSPERGLEIATDRLKADPGDPVVIGNLSSIAGSNSPKALPLLVTIAKSSTNQNARREAASAIGRSRNDTNGLTILEDLYTSSSDNLELRKNIVASIGRSTDPRTIAVLSRIAKSDADDSVRRTAVQYLGNRKEPEALKALEDLLKTKG